MRKIWVIACREYKTAVRSKAFLITMFLMPVLMGGSVAMQLVFKKFDDNKEKKYVVMDRTGGIVAKWLVAKADEFNNQPSADPESQRSFASKINLEVVTSDDETPESLAKQRYELSQRVERDEIEGFLEIGPKVFEVRGDSAPSRKVDDDAAIRFQAKKPTQREFMAWASQAINSLVQIKRFGDKKIDQKEIEALQEQVPLKYKALTQKSAEGNYVDTNEGAQIANFLLPAVLIGLMFMVIMVGATPAMQGIIEEKSQRIAEVLLGSVSPFELMAGKLIGVIGVSLTMATVYLVGGYFVAYKFGVSDMLTIGLLIWFTIFLILALLIFGSLFIAIGAAAGDVKDTQMLMMPVMIIACLPFFALNQIIQDPNGKIAVVFSFFPFAAPMLLVARQSVPPGVPLVQMIGGIAVVLATTLLCVWAAGRIFRVGILMQGKGARISDLFRWAWRG